MNYDDTDDEDEINLEIMRKYHKIIDEIFDTRVEDVARIDTKRVQVQEGLRDENKFIERDLNTQLIRLIENTYNLESKGNSVLFIRNLRRKREWIKASFKGKLAESVLHELDRTERHFGPQAAVAVLLNLYALTAAKEADKAYVVGFLKTPPHPDETRNAVNTLTNKKVADNIRQAIASLTSEELEWLVRYLAQVKAWEGSESVNEDIPFFDLEIKSMLYGGRGFRGLVSDFNDKEIEHRSTSNPAYLQLTRFPRFLMYLGRIRDKIAGYLKDEWVGYEEVIRNAKKIANNLKAEFGNAEIADGFLEKIQFKKGFFGKGKARRQFPAELLQYFNERLAEFSSRDYRRAKVIFPFIKEMERIFSLRIEQLRSGKQTDVKGLKDALWPIVNSERYSAENILEETKRARDRIKGKIERLRAEFEYLSGNCLDASRDFFYARWQTIDLGIRKQILFRLQNALAYAKRLMPYVKHARQIADADLEVTTAIPAYGISLLSNLANASQLAEGVSENARSIADIFTERSIQEKIKELNTYMEIVEREYKVLDQFMENNLKFLISQAGQETSVPTQSSLVSERREEDGRTTATRRTA